MKPVRDRSIRSLHLFSAVAILALAAAPTGCTPAAKKTQLVSAPAEGDVAALVKKELDRAHAQKRSLLVYVGAKWCEPCERFHHAVDAGQLDSTFPSLRLIAFDLDRDRERLQAAGYTSKYIPLFALPGPDGRASGRQIEGSVKGPGAVGEIAPRLHELVD